MAKVFIGVDPHKLSATIEVVDGRERVLATGRFGTDKAGYAAMRKQVASYPDRVWAVEGSNGTGRPLAQRLLADGEHVVDVPAKLSARASAGQPRCDCRSGRGEPLRQPAVCGGGSARSRRSSARALPPC